LTDHYIFGKFACSNFISILVIQKRPIVDRNYTFLKNNKWFHKGYTLVPIRDEDKFLIMKWRNEQLFHLRQNSPLTVVDQKRYFKNVVNKLFETDVPDQILFSLLQNDVCIGYGGLVHINWTDMNAEISFVMNTELEKLEFEKNWEIFLNLIQKIAFEEVHFHKIYTFAFDLRPRLYAALTHEGFKEEARLSEHVRHLDTFIDVLIHSKFNTRLS
jgi:hypothetical protein